MELKEDEYLAHYGILRRSGRYPWGSGGDVPQRSRSFLQTVEDLKNKGYSDVEIAKSYGMSTTTLRELRTVARNQIKVEQIAMAERLSAKGMGPTAIGTRMGIPESSVRALLAPGTKERAEILQNTADVLKTAVDERGLIDVGHATEIQLGVSSTKMKAAVALLKDQGYEVHNIPITQIGTGHDTPTRVLCPPGTTQHEAWTRRHEIQQIREFSDDGGRTHYGLKEPLKVDPSRVGILYGEDGGAQADGVIFVRPGVEDVSLGGARYAQVRIAIGDGHYMKGMAMYRDDLPEGTDLLFNTNKSDTGNMFDALKTISDDPDNPFGAVIDRQILEVPADRNSRLTSAMNLVNEEGNWADWSSTISAQALSKQSPRLAKTQLDMTFERRKKEFDEIMALTNPTVRKKLLEDFADATDAAAVHLKTAGLPRQGWHAILPIRSMPPGQVYAPNYRDGEPVVLIRYPHGGKFEIPELTVNNSNREAKRLLGDARDAVGIHHSVAQRLSGADFDGDTVLVIPNKRGMIETAPALDGLKDFDPISSYKDSGNSWHADMTPFQRNRIKQTQMGLVSNLITDMTLHGANQTEIAAAVRHSMVVIDSDKHSLDYKRSAIDNGIPKLKEKYQGSTRAGASTLISRAGARVKINERKPRPASEGGAVDPDTGKLVFVDKGGTYVTKTGKVVPKGTWVKRLSTVDDARELSSGTRMEELYADHSNKLKDLANQSRREAVRTPPAVYNESAARTYSSEVASLNAKLLRAQRNAPFERQAQVMAQAVIRQKRHDNPDMDAVTRKKIEFQALEESRIRVGAKKYQIDLTDREWEAIQAGAIRKTNLSKIINNADQERLLQLATPRRDLVMTSAKTVRARAMLANGATRAEVAAQLGVSLSTLDATLKAGD